VLQLVSYWTTGTSRGVGSGIGVLILYLGSWLGWRVNAYIPRR
jgi:hypothetical protein